jgi:hypothetical protein
MMTEQCYYIETGTKMGNAFATIAVYPDIPVPFRVRSTIRGASQCKVSGKDP